jgi:hypothetical protein
MNFFKLNELAIEFRSDIGINHNDPIDFFPLITNVLLMSRNILLFVYYYSCAIKQQIYSFCDILDVGPFKFLFGQDSISC